MGDWLREARYSVRLLLKEPGTLTITIASLALGIGVSTAVLTVARSVLLEPLPVPRPSELRLVHWGAEKGANSVSQISSSDTRDAQTGRVLRSNFSYSAFTALKAAADGHADLFGFSLLRQVNLSAGEQPAAGGAMFVSGNFFGSLRVPMALGRGLNEDDDRPGAPLAVVLAHGVWQRMFGADASAIGRPIRINGQPFTIVGVTAPAYFGVSNGGFFPPADVTVALRAQPVVAPRWTPRSGSLFTDDATFWVRAMARVTTPSGEAALQPRLAAAFTTHPSATPLERSEIVLRPGARGLASLRTAFERPLSILGGVAVLVFVLACLNTAGLVLVRSLARQRDLWVRLALGASRARLVRHAVVDSVILSATGGLGAVAISVWGARWLTSMLAGPRANAINIDVNVSLLLTAVAVSCGAALLFGVLPVIKVARVSVAPDFLRSSGVSARAPRLRAGRLLIAAQISLALPLVIGAMLLLRTVHNLTSVDLGFAPANLVVFKLDPSLNGRDGNESKALLERVVERLEDLPGVRGATLLENTLVTNSSSNTSMSVDSEERKRIQVNRVGPRFVETMGMQLVAGRDFTRQDREGTTMVGIVNEAAVREYFGGAPPIGRLVRMYGFVPHTPIEIVGVTRDSTYATLRGRIPPTMFLPFLQAADIRAGAIAVRTDATPSMIEGIRRTVAQIDRDIPVTDLKTQVAQIDEHIGTERMFRTLLVFFGSIALALACIGLHGITSYLVARRASEIGVRMALGARRSAIVSLILRQVATVTALGLIAGVPIAVYGARLLQSMLFGVQPADPWSLAAGVATVACVTLVAGYLPARRAAQLDPLRALRAE
jgi:predicted permease